MADFKTWFEQKYIDWLTKRGKRGSIREFSELLGVDQRLVSNWMNGNKRPGPDSADRIAIFLNYDLSVYEVLGLPVPEKRLLEFKAMYPSMTDEDVADLDKFLEKVRKRHAAEEKRNLSKTGPVDPDGSLIHA
jgi:transcriptional regulator with XRE-family HTH domain